MTLATLLTHLTIVRQRLLGVLELGNESSKVQGSKSETEPLL